MGDTEENRPPAIPWRGKADNIKLDIGEADCKDLDWIHLARDGVQRPTFMNTVMNLLVP
jgi:hypothetical protein